ncbi:MAG: vitamin K epoxide reductase family protein [Patescibacteria group bacterium]
MDKRLSTFLIGSIILLSFIGFADSSYLLAKRLSGAPIPCALGFSGCDTVDKSPYSAFLGIPLSAYGMAFYLIIGFLAILYLDTKRVLFARLILPIATLGFISSAYFVYLQAFVIKAFCIFCLVSAGVSALLFILAVMIYRKTSLPS